MVAEHAKQAAIKAVMKMETWWPSRFGPCSSPERIHKIRDTATGIVEEVIRHIEPEDKGMFSKLSQTEYGYTAGESLANGGLYVNDHGRVFFLTDAEFHQLTSLPSASEQAAPMPGPFSCHVHVASVYSNTGGEGSTATLEFEEGGGIDIRPGGSMTDTIQIQVTADTEELVKQGKVIKLTLSAIEETP